VNDDLPPIDIIPGEGLGNLEPRLGLRRDVVDEIRWTFTSRLGWIIQVMANLAIGIPFVLISSWNAQHDSIRVGGFATSLAGWALASVINTNQLGFDADRVGRSLQRGDEVVRILFFKNLALLVVLAPPIMVLTAILRVTVVHDPHNIPMALTRDVADFTMWLGFGSVLSVLLPFRPLGWRRRFQRRPTWFRTAVCVAIPYGVYYVIFPGWHVCELSVADALFHHQLRGHEWGFSLVLLGASLLTWAGGLALAQLYSIAARPRLLLDLDRDG
jgi:hypothetical protein